MTMLTQSKRVHHRHTWTALCGILSRLDIGKGFWVIIMWVHLTYPHINALLVFIKKKIAVHSLHLRSQCLNFLACQRRTDVSKSCLYQSDSNIISLKIDRKMISL